MILGEKKGRAVVQSGEHLEWERGIMRAHGGEVMGTRFIPEHGEVALL